ncbi:hypothetical protein HDU76_005327, partial [Blyttiomyces sp. JEL0837]
MSDSNPQPQTATPAQSSNQQQPHESNPSPIDQTQVSMVTSSAQQNSQPASRPSTSPKTTSILYKPASTAPDNKPSSEHQTESSNPSSSQTQENASLDNNLNEQNRRSMPVIPRVAFKQDESEFQSTPNATSSASRLPHVPTGTGTSPPSTSLNSLKNNSPSRRVSQRSGGPSKLGGRKPSGEVGSGSGGNGSGTVSFAVGSPGTVISYRGYGSRQGSAADSVSASMMTGGNVEGVPIEKPTILIYPRKSIVTSRPSLAGAAADVQGSQSGIPRSVSIKSVRDQAGYYTSSGDGGIPRSLSSWSVKGANGIKSGMSASRSLGNLRKSLPQVQGSPSMVEGEPWDL